MQHQINNHLAPRVGFAHLLLPILLSILSFISAFTVMPTIAAEVKAAKKPLIPLEHFNQMPMVSSPVISPDGNNIAVILNQGEFAQVAVVPFSDRAAVKVLLRLGAEKYRIEDIDWVNDERIIVSVSQPYRVDNSRLRTTHLYSAKIDGSNVFEMRKRLRKNSPRNFYYNSPKLLSLLKDDPKHILVTLSDPRDNNYSSVFKLNVESGKFDKYLPNSKRIVNWGVSRAGDILLAVGVDKDRDKDINYIYTRKNTDADWQLVKTIEAFKSETFSPQIYDAKTNTVIVLSNHRENKEEVRKTALWRFDISTGKYTERLSETPDNVDVTDAITRLEGGEYKVVGYIYNDNFNRYVYFDKNKGALAQQISGLFAKQGLQAFLWHWDQSEKRYIVGTVSDKNPSKYYLFDAATKKITPWYGAYPDLEKSSLASVQPFEFEAADGMKLHGYLTLPNEVENPPVVLFPHGGPYVRDSQYFDPFVQMFASRGFAVLQVNFRGSTGYGSDYKTAGYRQWGKKMQTDLVDALKWVKASGQADADNACIVGASYGGYAALVAGYQTPERFKCIISIAGISDLEIQVREFKSQGYDEYAKNAVADDPKEMRKLSPVDYAAKFKAPVLLIHGKVDTVVRYEQSEYMFDALEDAGKSVEYELFDYGTHHLDDAANRKKAMVLMADFLAKHL